MTAFGAFLVAQQAARRMLATGGGCIMLTGASAGVKGFPQSAPFAMGKFALRGLAQSMARELHPQGIHVVHVVVDGAIRRQRPRRGRAGQPSRPGRDRQHHGGHAATSRGPAGRTRSPCGPGWSGSDRPMRLDDLPTPCLVLDRAMLAAQPGRHGARCARHGVALRPHMKTAKSVDVARLALAGQPGGITVSTLAEAEYFAGHGMRDQLYAVGITPQKLARVAELNAAGADIAVITDDLAMAAAIAASPTPVRALIEVDTGEGRGGLTPGSPHLGRLAAALGDRLAGVLTHAGHSYACRSAAELAAVAEAERAGIVGAAQTLHGAWRQPPIVSMGSTPTALHARHLDGVTELRAGVYMFGDLFQMQVGGVGLESVALTVLTSVIGHRPGEHRLLVDAGGLALSKDHSTAAAPVDYGFGLVLDRAGEAALGGATIGRAYQEHGVVELDPALAYPDLPIGAKLRIAPNHACMTAAAHDRYHVVDGGEAVAATWPRVNGW